VLVIDNAASGHHPSYARWLLESDLGRSSQVILAAPPAMFEHPEILASESKCLRHEIDPEQKLDFRHFASSAVGMARRSWALGRLYREVCASLARTEPVDFVIVPFLDDCILGLAFSRDAFGGIPWIGITMRTMFHYRDVGVVAPPQPFIGLRRWLLQRLLKQPSMVSLLTIDPTLADFAGTQKHSYMRKVEYLPDPSTFHPVLPTRHEARRELKIPADVSLVLAFGEISSTKGVDLLLEAAADPMCSPRVHILLAGRCNDRGTLFSSVAFQRLSAAGRIHIVEGYIRGFEERQVLAAADCMWIGHIDFYGTSGVMVLAARHGIPVLATEQGLIGYLAKKHDIGVIIQPRNRSSVLNALSRLVNEPDWFREVGKAAISAFDRHDPEEFQRLVTEKAEVHMLANQ
jgi:glycosyltransferase involved in cell wall biosynthesis